MSAPEVSVVMPVYNADRYLAEAIESILAQTFGDFEFLVLDDGSTDRSLEIARHYAASDRRIQVLPRTHRGYTACLNEGIRAARGEFVARMDSDDVSYPRRLEKQLLFLRSHPQCVAVGSDTLHVDEDRNPICVHLHDIRHEEIEADLLGGGLGVISHPSCMVRRSAMLAIGGYRVHCEPLEDLDLWYRLAEIGKLANLPEVLLEYRQHYANVTNTQTERQKRLAGPIVTEARMRRGLPPLSHEIWTSERPATPDLHRHWARKATFSGFRVTGLKHGWRALRLDPFTVSSWTTLIIALLPCPERTLPPLRALKRQVRSWFLFAL